MVPVMGRVTINGTQSQFSCKKTIPLDMWDVKGNCAISANLPFIGYPRTLNALSCIRSVEADKKKSQ